MEENKVNYLRFSITDRCNMACIYCMPKEKMQFFSHNEVLKYEEIVRLVKIFVKLGIDKLRLTGGEPLIKRNIVGLIEMLKSIKGLREIALTTNGLKLKRWAKRLKDAGLDRINISLDTLRKDRFAYITKRDCFIEVWQGIERCLELGLGIVKLNVVLMRSLNDDEIKDFVRLTIARNITVRFIELLNTDEHSKLSNSIIKTDEVRKRIVEYFGQIDPFVVKGNGPADYYKVPGARGAIGFIQAANPHICSRCNKIRVDCLGRIYPCLFSGYIYDLRRCLRASSADEPLYTQIAYILLLKLRYNQDIIKDYHIQMSNIGG